MTVSTPEGWRAGQLGDFIELKRGYDLPSRERRDGPFPIVSSSGPSGTHVEAKVKGPGVVTGRYGTIGQVFFIEGDYWPLNSALYVRDFKGSDPRFVSYFLRSIDFFKYVDKAAVPGVNRNHVHLEEVAFPPFDEQRRIAAVLGALDDKIELNRKMNRTLEEMAQAIFKSWFIDFDGHDDLVDSEIGPVPRGWEVRSLDAIADFLNGAACQKYPATDGEPWLPVIKIRELNQGVTAQTDRATATIPDKWHVRDGDVLFSWSGSLVVKVWTGGAGALNQHLFKVTSEAYPRWFYLSWVQHHLAEFQRIAADKATTMGHIKRHHLTDAKCAVPPADVLARVGTLLEPIVNRQVANELESRTLSDLRDTLLPKLISGELRVPEAEEAVGAASGPLSQYAAGEATAP